MFTMKLHALHCAMILHLSLSDNHHDAWMCGARAASTICNHITLLYKKRVSLNTQKLRAAVLICPVHHFISERLHDAPTVNKNSSAASPVHAPPPSLCARGGCWKAKQEDTYPEHEGVNDEERLEAGDDGFGLHGGPQCEPLWRRWRGQKQQKRLNASRRSGAAQCTDAAARRRCWPESQKNKQNTNLI